MTAPSDPVRDAAKAECRRLEEMLAHRGMLDTAHRLIHARAAAQPQPDARYQQAMAIINAAWMALPEHLRQSMADNADDATGNPLPAAVQALAKMVQPVAPLTDARDAARYRRLRDGALTSKAETIAMWEANSCQELDAAIDAILESELRAPSQPVASGDAPMDPK